MAQPVNWGILGAANFARQHMGRAIHAACGGRLAALATSDSSKAAAFLDFAPDCRVHDSYEALIADPEIDAIYIPLPNHLHVEWTVRAAEAGKHVLCEKPIALEASEIDDLIAVRTRTERLIAEAFMIVHHPQWQLARDLVQRKAMGTLLRVDAAFSFYNDDVGNIRNQSAAGGGGLRDIGVYIFGGTRFATGEEPSDILSVDMESHNDVDTRVSLSARLPTFHGSDAVLKLTAPFNAQVYDQAELVLRHKDDGIRVWKFPADNHYVRQVEAFNRSIRDGAAYPCSLEFSRGTQEMMDRVFRHVAPGA